MVGEGVREKKMVVGKVRRGKRGGGKEREEGRGGHRPLSPPLPSHASLQKPLSYRSRPSSFHSSSLLSISHSLRHTILFLDDYAPQTRKGGKRREERGRRGWRGKEAILFAPPPRYSIPDHLLGGVYGLVQREERVAKGGAMVVYGLAFLWTGE